MTTDNGSDSHDPVSKSAALHASAKESMKKPLPRRFYKVTSVTPVAAGGSSPALYQVLLDGRPIRTPARKLPLAVKTECLGHAIADEWSAQGELIDPATMPLTRMANTAIDGVAQAMDDVRAEIVKYAASDLLFYRAAAPQGLVALQEQRWDPLLDRIEQQFDARFILTQGIIHVTQPEGSLEQIASAVSTLEPYMLTAVHVITTLTGSALLALLVQRGVITPEQAWTAAHADEDWQISQWGDDAEAAERREVRHAEMLAAGRFLSLLAQ